VLRFELLLYLRMMLDISRIGAQVLATRPFGWTAIDETFERRTAAALAIAFPSDHFKRVAGYDGEKSYQYRARSLIHMGASSPSHVDGLSPEWQSLASDLLAPQYRQALMSLTGLDLREALLEANITEYGPSAWLGPHVDLREKLVTHVLYFNEVWNTGDGGCLRILGSPEPADVVHEVIPVAGCSVVLKRSDQSWHMVTRVRRGRRRAVNVIFHQPGSISTMWPQRTGHSRIRSRLQSWRTVLKRF
jgi:Rps23 Pro-64 3,4-dihydroxylase Tpa1-like proline 4-hydroxylase